MPPRRSKLPAQFPLDWTVTDTAKKSWNLGRKLGEGGCGSIYLACPASDAPVGADAAYIIKVENHQNGPLFCELKFYQRAAKQDDVTKWIQSHKLDYLGIPRYWGSGEMTYNSVSYRFMVIDRLGSDLVNLQKNNSGRLPLQTVLQVSIRMLDVLEYIHEHEYVHGDIKAGNILCHLSDPSKVYLADYGLSYRYCPDGKHKEYKEDPRKCHNGTLEFTSLDAHKGAAPSRRGDLEILSFCMLHWLSGRLPWVRNIKAPCTVQAAKQKLFDDAPNSVTAWLGQEDGCHDIAKFMMEVHALQYSAKPNYKGLKGILLKALDCTGTRLRAPLNFSNWSSAPRPAAVKTQTEVLKPHLNGMDDDDNYDDDEDDDYDDDYKEKEYSQPPKSFNSPNPCPIRKTPKQVKKTTGADPVNDHEERQTHFVGSDNYRESSKVQRPRPSNLRSRVGIHEPKTEVLKPHLNGMDDDDDNNYDDDDDVDDDDYDDDDYKEEEYSQPPKSFNSPNPRPIRRTPKQVEKTTEVDPINGNHEFRTHFDDRNNYRKSSKVQGLRSSDLRARGGIHEPKSTAKFHTTQHYEDDDDVDSNPCCQKSNAYREESAASSKDPTTRHQNWKDTYKYLLAIQILLLIIYCALYVL